MPKYQKALKLAIQALKVDDMIKEAYEGDESSVTSVGSTVFRGTVRKLPHIINTDEFWRDDSVGLYGNQYVEEDEQRLDTADFAEDTETSPKILTTEELYNATPPGFNIPAVPPLPGSNNIPAVPPLPGSNSIPPPPPPPLPTNNIPPPPPLPTNSIPPPTVQPTPGNNPIPILPPLNNKPPLPSLGNNQQMPANNLPVPPPPLPPTAITQSNQPKPPVPPPNMQSKPEEPGTSIPLPPASSFQKNLAKALECNFYTVRQKIVDGEVAGDLSVSSTLNYEKKVLSNLYADIPGDSKPNPAAQPKAVPPPVNRPPPAPVSNLPPPPVNRLPPPPASNIPLPPVSNIPPPNPVQTQSEQSAQSSPKNSVSNSMNDKRAMLANIFGGGGMPRPAPRRVVESDEDEQGSSEPPSQVQASPEPLPTTTPKPIIPPIPISKPPEPAKEVPKVPSSSVIFKEPEESPVVNQPSRSVFEQDLDESSLFIDRNTTNKPSSKLNKLFEQLGENESKSKSSTKEMARPTIFEEETQSSSDISSILNSKFAQRKEVKEAEPSQVAKLDRLSTPKLFGEEETPKPAPFKLPFPVAGLAPGGAAPAPKAKASNVDNDMAMARPIMRSRNKTRSRMEQLLGFDDTETDSLFAMAKTRPSLFTGEPKESRPSVKQEEEPPARPSAADRKSVIFEDEAPSRPSISMRKSIFDEEEPKPKKKSKKSASIFQEEAPPKSSNIKSVFDAEKPAKSSVLDAPSTSGRKSIFEEDLPIKPKGKSKLEEAPNRKSIFDEDEPLSSFSKGSKSSKPSLLDESPSKSSSTKRTERLSRSIFEEDEDLSFHPKLKHSASTIQPPASKKGPTKYQAGRNTIFESDEEDPKLTKQASVIAPKANPRSVLFESSDEEDQRRRPNAKPKAGKAGRSALFDD